MFRTSNNRGSQRFQDLQSHNFKKDGHLQLTATQIKLIEETSLLSLNEKIELFLVTLGNKLTTEVFSRIYYHFDLKLNQDVPKMENLTLLKNLFDQLPFAYFQDHLQKTNRQTGHQEKFTWFQVSLNEAVAHFMKKYADDLTEFEEGVLYGYPLSAIRAFSFLLEPNHDKPNPSTYFLAGVCSQDFKKDEKDYYELWWKRLKVLSPQIVKIAEEKFEEMRKKNEP